MNDLREPFIKQGRGFQNWLHSYKMEVPFPELSRAQFWLRLPSFSATFGKGSLFFCRLQQIGCQKAFNKLKKNNLPIYTKTMDAKWATLEEMGLRSAKAVAKHILEENTWESNLFPDIANVDYFAGHQEPTNLQPLDGLPVFVDDIYVYGPLRENEIVRVRGRKTACTTGEDDSGRRIISQIFLSSSGKPRALKTGSKTLQSPKQSTRNPSAPVS